MMKYFCFGSVGGIGSHSGNIGVVRRKFMGAAVFDLAFGAHLRDIMITDSAFPLRYLATFPERVYL